MTEHLLLRTFLNDSVSPNRIQWGTHEDVIWWSTWLYPRVSTLISLALMKSWKWTKVNHMMIPLKVSRTATLRTFTRKVSNIDFFFPKILPLKDDELPMSEMQKKMGVTDFVLERIWGEDHLWVNRVSLAKKATVAVSPKILQLDLWREMFSAKYALNGPMKRI